MAGGTVVREATRGDAAAVARIGRAALPAQYEGLVDAAAVAAAVEQSYAIGPLEACIERCAAADDAHLLVAERDGTVIGFLHFDTFGPEPELHRLYVEAGARGLQVGAALMQALHERLEPDAPYMLLVLAGNDRAVAFYERHGLVDAGGVDGLTTYRDHMGVAFPPDTRPFELVLMRRGHRRR